MKAITGNKGNEKCRAILSADAGYCKQMLAIAEALWLLEHEFVLSYSAEGDGISIDFPTESADGPLSLQAPDDRAYLTPYDVGRRLRIKTAATNRLLKSGEIGIIKVGNDVRIHPAELDAYLERAKK